jgi:predicted DNA-binding antitoxin AbrB/MazE fold protein
LNAAIVSGRYSVIQVELPEGGRSVTGAVDMTITVEAVYENGILKPTEALPLDEQQRVHLVVRTEPSPVLQSAGIIPWTGDPETLRRIAEDPEFGIAGRDGNQPAMRTA